MSGEGARFEAWLQRRRGRREPLLEAELLTVVDAYDTAKQGRTLKPEELQLIADAASDSRALLWQNAVAFMGVLSEQWPEANAAILAMAQSRKAHVRFNALCCLGESTPFSTVEQVLKSGLRDKSARVRGKAADRMGQLRKLEFVPELTAALTNERDPKARSTMEFELRLLRDGYILEPAQGGGFRVTVHTD